MDQRLVDLHGAFAFVFAADVLENEDIAVAGHVAVGRKPGKIDGTVFFQGQVGPVGGALDKNGQGFGSADGR